MAHFSSTPNFPIGQNSRPITVLCGWFSVTWHCTHGFMWTAWLHVLRNCTRSHSYISQAHTLVGVPVHSHNTLHTHESMEFNALYKQTWNWAAPILDSLLWWAVLSSIRSISCTQWCMYLYMNSWQACVPWQLSFGCRSVAGMDVLLKASLIQLGSHFNFIVYLL